MALPFTYATISQTYTDESIENAESATSEMSEDAPVSFRGALNMLRDGCWDNLDWRAEEVICYPADWHQDFGTGEWDSETLVIRSRRPEWLSRLSCAYYEKGN